MGGQLRLVHVGLDVGGGGGGGRGGETRMLITYNPKFNKSQYITFFVVVSHDVCA